MKTRSIHIISLIAMLLVTLALLRSAPFLKAAAASNTTTWIFTGTQLPPDTQYPGTAIGTINGTLTTSSDCGVSLIYCPLLSLNLYDSAFGDTITLADSPTAYLALNLADPYLNNVVNQSVPSMDGHAIYEVIYSGRTYASQDANLWPNGGVYGPLHGTYVITKAPNPPPTLAEYLQLSDAAYGLDTGSFVVPSGYGMTVLPDSFLPIAQQPVDGFEAYAVKDSNGNIIIANEGTKLEKTTFGLNSLKADFAIYKDQNAQALADARAFAQQVEQDNPGKIYVTGHSLGGIEAEAEAQWLGENFAGGNIFGATGLPLNSTADIASTLINYVDSSDPIGNYASDLSCALHGHTAGVMFNYGQVVIIGTSNVLTTSVEEREASLLAVPPQFGGGRNDDGAFIVNLDNAIFLQYHSRKNYAADLNIPLTQPVGTVAPGISLDEWSLTYGEQLGNVGLSDAEATAVSNATTLVAPDMTLKFDPSTNQSNLTETSNMQEPWGTMQAGGKTTMAVDPQTGLITNETYKAPDSSIFNATLDSSETVTVVQVNPSTGGSYQIAYDTTNSQPWSSYTTVYNKPNEKGTVIESIYNWRAGGSEVHLFTGLPSGYTEEIQEYSGPTGTGTLLSTQFI